MLVNFFCLVQTASPMFVDTKSEELVSKIVTGGIEVRSRFTRSPHLASSEFVSVEMKLTNGGKLPIKDVQLDSEVPINSNLFHL